MLWTTAAHFSELSTGGIHKVSHTTFKQNSSKFTFHAGSWSNQKVANLPTRPSEFCRRVHAPGTLSLYLSTDPHLHVSGSDKLRSVLLIHHITHYASPICHCSHILIMPQNLDIPHIPLLLQFSTSLQLLDPFPSCLSYGPPLPWPMPNTSCHFILTAPLHSVHPR